MRRTTPVLILVAGLLLLPGPVGAGEGDPFPADTIAVGLDATSTIDVTLELSQATFPDGGADVVLIGRSDVFADSLASGVLQDEGPLLLVPTAGPVPAAVMAEIDRIGARTAVILGGEAAVSATVADQLSGEGLAVERLSGPSRIETAVAVAGRTTGATTAILARAGGVEGNPTSGFADTLAAGGWAAETGWPVLLTQTEVLTGSTRDHLSSAGITTVHIVGGTAAVSEAVADELRGMGMTVERVSGSDRAATAVAIAEARGAGDVADVDRVIVVDGFSEEAWAAGFGAAAMSAGGAATTTRQREGTPAPVVLGNVEDLPPATRDYLAPGPGTITCAVTLQVCDAARTEIGLDPVVPVAVPVGTLLYGTGTAAGTGQVRAAAFDGTDVGFVHTCVEGPCGEMDWTERGDIMSLHETGVAGVFFRVEAGVPTVGQRFPNPNIQDVIDLSEVPDDPDYLYHALGGQCTGQPFSAGGGCGGGSATQDRSISTLQSLAAHAGATNAEGMTTMLYRESDGQMLVETIRSFEGFDSVPAHLQIRPGAQLIGSALDPAGSGDIAMVDAIAGAATLRIAPWPDGEVLQPDLRVLSDPYWLPGGETVVVVAEDGGTSQLVAVDAATGAVQVLVDDAGPDIAERVEADASGTLIAWRSGNEIRVLNTATGEVATVRPPEGHTITSGPSFRPSA